MVRGIPVARAPKLAAHLVAEQVYAQRSLNTLALMRTEGVSFTRSAARAGISRGAALRRVGGVLKRTRSGRYVAKSADRIRRDLQVLTTRGLKTLDLRGSRVASTVGEHWNAVHRFLETGDVSVLRPFRDKSVAGYRLETRPAVIERLGHRGELSFEDIYEG